MDPSECFSCLWIPLMDHLPLRANMSCVIVPYVITRAMELCEVEHRFDSISDVSLEEVLKIVAK